MSDYTALRAALANHVTFGEGGRFSYDTEPWQAAADPATIAALLAALDEARRDAGRYRFLRADFSVMGANIDGNHSWAYRRNFSLRGPTLDAAIDAAMKGTP